MRSAVPVSVVIPTLGRLEVLPACLESIAACDPAADEILVVAQSDSPALDSLVERFTVAGARLVRCPGRGVARNRNLGLREARHEIVLVTDDDCTVAQDWIGTAWRLMSSDPNQIVTGRVLPSGDARAIPETNEDPTPHDYTGMIVDAALFPNNMALNRSRVLEIGGFDERFGPAEAAEDNDFCYRWLRAGRRLRYEPALVVWHHDWREPAALEELYARYARGQGFLYAKHLRRGDPTMLRFIARDLYRALRGLAAALVKGRERWTDPRRAILRRLPAGLVDGWGVFRAERGTRSTGLDRGRP